MNEVLIAACAGLMLAAGTGACGYIAGRRSSREELAAAHMAWAVQNAAPERDDLALPPERTEAPSVELRAEYDEDLADLVLVASRMATDTGQRYSMEEVMAEHGITEEELDALPPEPDPDDTWQGTLSYLQKPSADTWAPAAPARERNR